MIRQHDLEEARLEHRGVEAQRVAVDEITVRVPLDEHERFARANKLTMNNVIQGAWSLLLSRHSFDTAGTPVEWAQSRYRGDRYEIVMAVDGGK